MKTSLSVEQVKAKGAGPVKKGFLKKELGVDERDHVGVLKIDDINAVMVFPYDIQNGITPKLQMVVNLLNKMDLVAPEDLAKIDQGMSLPPDHEGEGE